MTFFTHKWLRAVFLVLGLIFLFYFVWQLGITTILTYLRQIGFGMVWPLAIAGGWYLLNCFAWEQFLANRHHSLPFYRLFSIKVAGEAINSVTPVSWIGGDPLRIALMRPFFRTSEGTASVILDRTVHSFATALMMASGVVLALATFHLSAPLRFGLASLVALLFVSLSLTIRHQHRGLLNGLIYAADRLGMRRFINAGLRSRATEIDCEIQAFYHVKRQRLFFSFVLHVAGRLLGVVEIYVIALLLGIPLGFLAAYLLAVLSTIINLLFVLIPGGVGVMEGAYGGLFHILALDPAAGVALQLVRRIRTLVWTGIGLGFIVAFKHKHPNLDKPPTL